ncbi:hypothetical protein K443DRAFT_9023 [Laccaria amethystina LaAM-08-1]|uniref:Uncharacterized protein n=1 Tax=Laccaria amethystina LaAM-08-1 TaxID=1095629 RepID=A0A0C9X0C6_9AGAR|nr:hypothetical protein K443DRAFT_9023 [Laccaria amethystina LaAM-08-1]
MSPTSQSQLPLYCLFSTAEPNYLVHPFAAFLDYVDHWEDLSDATLHRHPEKKKLETTKGVANHIKFIAVALNTVYAGRANRRFLERRGEAKFSSSPPGHNADSRNRGGVEKTVVGDVRVCGRVGGGVVLVRVKLRGTFVHTSDPDRMQAKDLQLVWLNAVPSHPAHFIPTNQPNHELNSD